MFNSYTYIIRLDLATFHWNWVIFNKAIEDISSGNTCYSADNKNDKRIFRSYYMQLYFNKKTSLNIEEIF